jgi:hypothetical protein
VTNYQPWVIVVVLFYLPIVFFHILPSLRLFKANSMAIVGSAVGLSPMLYYLFSFVDTFKIMSETTYPGTRRFESGSSTALNWAFSGPLDWSLLNPDGVLSSNQSEASLGFLFFIIPALFVAFFQYGKIGLDKIVASSTIVLFILVAWSTIPVPSFGLNPLTLVSPERALTASSTLAPIFFGIVLGRNAQLNSSKSHSNVNFNKQIFEASYPRYVLSIVAAFLTLWSSFTISSIVQPVPYIMSFMTSALVGYLVFALSSTRRLKTGLILSSAFSMFLGITVNPVVHGLDSLYKGDISKSIKRVGSNDLWASNSFALDAILTPLCRINYFKSILFS